MYSADNSLVPRPHPLCEGKGSGVASSPGSPPPLFFYSAHAHYKKRGGGEPGDEASSGDYCKISKPIRKQVASTTGGGLVSTVCACAEFLYISQ